METLLAVVVAWFVLSIPVSLLVGRFLAGRRAATTQQRIYGEHDVQVHERHSGLSTGSLTDLSPAPEQ